MEPGEGAGVLAGSDRDLFFPVKDPEVDVLDNDGDKLSGVARTELDALVGDRRPVTGMNFAPGTQGTGGQRWRRKRTGSTGHVGHAVTCQGNTPHERFRAEVSCYDGRPRGYSHTHYGNWVSTGHTSVAWCAAGDATGSYPFWGADT
ncbi:hypothetical protein GCM10022205_32970 [Spinactinospora alkalitolerans]